MPVGIQPRRHLRQLRTASHHSFRLGLTHPGDGGGQIETADTRLFDQLIQLRAAELRPPLLVAAGGAFIVRRLPRGGRLEAAVRDLGGAATCTE
ncbi:hypothetical protein D3C84_1114390 [compost metagenome]